MKEKWIKIKEKELALILELARIQVESKIIGNSIKSYVTASHYLKINEAKLTLLTGEKGK